MRKELMITVLDDSKLITSFIRYNVKPNTVLIVPEYYQANMVSPEETKTFNSGQEILYPLKISFWDNILYKLRIKRFDSHICDIHFINISKELSHSFFASDLDLFIMDRKLNIPIQINLKGFFAIKLKSLQKLFESNGIISSITAESIYLQFKPLFYMELKHQLSIFFIDQEVSILESSKILKPISERMFEYLSKKLEAIGLELTKLYITDVGFDSKIKELIQIEYFNVSKDLIKHNYDTKLSEDSLAQYKEKAKLYKEYNFAALTEDEKDKELKRQLARALAFKNYGYAFDFQFDNPISPSKPATIIERPTTIVSAPAISQEKLESEKPILKYCSVCGELLRTTDNICPNCSNMEGI